MICSLVVGICPGRRAQHSCRTRGHHHHLLRPHGPGVLERSRGVPTRQVPGGEQIRSWREKHSIWSRKEEVLGRNLGKNAGISVLLQPGETLHHRITRWKPAWPPARGRSDIRSQAFPSTPHPWTLIQHDAVSIRRLVLTTLINIRWGQCPWSFCRKYIIKLTIEVNIWFLTFCVFFWYFN